MEELLREGWKVVEQSERTDEFTYKDDDGELAKGEVYVTILQAPAVGMHAEYPLHDRIIEGGHG